MTANEDKVASVLSAILKSKGLSQPTLSAETALDGSLGLDSLDFAEMVVQMEGITGKDPFSGGSFPSIRTVADLAALYD